MNRYINLPGVASTQVPLRFSHRAQLRIEVELKASINDVFKRLGDFGSNAEWGELAELVTEIGMDAAREPSARATKLAKDTVADVLDAAVAEVGREGVAEILRAGIALGATKSGEAQSDEGPKGTNPPTT